MKKAFQWLSFILLVLADWLAFHDVAEPHTVRDWLVVAATVLLLLTLFERNRQQHTV